MQGGTCDVFFYEAFEEEVPELQKHLGPDVKAAFTWKTIQEEAHPAPPATLVSIRTQSTLPAAWAHPLRGVLARSTGYDHLLAWRQATGSPAALGCLSKYCGRAVAEQAALSWMAILRKLPRQMAQFAEFSRDGLTGGECEHRTLAVVGVGDIGHEVVRVGRGLGMHVLGVDIVHRHHDVAYVDIDVALAKAHVIVCAMNLTAANAHYFNYDRLLKARRGAIFVNVSRGEFSPSADLLRLVDEGILGGAALDVYEHEQDIAYALRGGSASDRAEVAAILKLRERPNVLLTPHNAFNTVEALTRKAGQSAQQVHHFLKTGEFIWKV